jgi:hypothetical protein
LDFYAGAGSSLGSIRSGQHDFSHDFGHRAKTNPGKDLKFPE